MMEIVRRATWVVALLGAAIVYASPVPKSIGFTGVLTDATGKPRPDGTYAVHLAMYTSVSGGTDVWHEDKTVTVAHGLFSTALGNTTVFPPALDFSQALFVGVSAGVDPQHLDPEMTPRLALQGAPYAMVAQSVANGSITASSLAPNVLPSTLPPSGTAGGDLAGTYPNPSLSSTYTSLAKVSAGGVSIEPSGELLDQKSEHLDGYCGGGGYFVQTFTAGATGSMVAFDFNFSLTAGSSEQVALNVYLDSPSTLLISQRILVSGSAGFQHFQLSTPVSVTSGTVYRWELSGTTHLDIGASIADTYPVGVGTLCGGAQDYVFRTYVAGTGTPVLSIGLDTGFHGSVGIGTSAPTAPLDVRGAIKLGANGEYFATSDGEGLRLVRGLVNSNGSANFGSGFAVTHLGAGHYHLAITPAFHGFPVVTATANNGSAAGTATVGSYVWDGTNSGLDVFTWQGTSASDQSWNFTAIGPK